VVPRGERIELGDDGRVPAHLDLRGDAVLRRRQPQLLEPQRGLVRHVGERVRTPQRERVGQGRGGRRRMGRDLSLPVLYERLEPRRVDLLGRCRDHVSAVAALHPAIPEQPTQAVDVGLQGVAGALGRLLAPEPVDQQVRPDDPVRPKDQVCEDRPLFRAAEGELPPVLADLERTQDQELHRRNRTTAPRRTEAMPAR
jgi:hypothetical protein